FSGGVSDSLYGVSAYVVEKDMKTSAKKAWFMFDQEIVCLGAGISSELHHPISTTVNQSVFDDKKGVYLGEKKNYHALSTDTVLSLKKGVQKVIHDGVAYLFPQKEHLKLSIEKRVGDESAIRGG